MELTDKIFHMRQMDVDVGALSKATVFEKEKV
jgi:hypothetical protein